MTANEDKHPKGYWTGVGISIGIGTRRIADGQTVTVDGSAGTVKLK